MIYQKLFNELSFLFASQKQPLIVFDNSMSGIFVRICEMSIGILHTM